MDIIKFRIYDPINKKMVYSGATPTMLSSFFSRTASFNTLHRMQYQMFTGLSDCNGKEIFEGDIIFDPTEYGGYKNVAWNQGMLAFELRPMLGLTIRASDRYEVIGNTYENPGLLEKGE